MTNFLDEFDHPVGYLSSLYEKATQGHWNPDVDIDWSQEVDLEYFYSSHLATSTMMTSILPSGVFPSSSTATEQYQLCDDYYLWIVSQFLHTEQAALTCCSLLLDRLPSFDARLCLGMQVAEETRHAVAFRRYIEEHFDRGGHQVSEGTLGVVDNIVADGRWDIIVLGMHVFIEGSALAALGLLHESGSDKLLRQICRYVMTDEARHVAFGSTLLTPLYAELTSHELFERQEIALELVRSIQLRYRPVEIISSHASTHTDSALMSGCFDTPAWLSYETEILRKTLNLCRNIGLANANDGWLERKFSQIHLV